MDETGRPDRQRRARGERRQRDGVQHEHREAVPARDLVEKPADEVAAAYARTVTDHGQNIQVSNTTKLNRYPGLFTAVAAIAGAAGIVQPDILSFGSSTGEEVFTLTEYFPGSAVLGLEINDTAIAQARAAYGDTPGVRFEKSGAFDVAAGSLDIVFALSVLCRWPVTRRMDAIGDLYPFSAFEQHVAYLDSLLKPGGLLVIFNANYSFLHSRVSLGYDLVGHPRLARKGVVKRFRRDGTFDPDFTGSDCIYYKQREDERHGERGLMVRGPDMNRIAMIERDVAIA